MSTETLRDAAALMRRERGANEFYLAVADWLDDEAIQASDAIRPHPLALTVARAYLGEATA